MTDIHVYIHQQFLKNMIPKFERGSSTFRKFEQASGIIVCGACAFAICSNNEA